MTQKRFETVTVKMKSANTCTKLIHQKGIASVSISETMGFEIHTIYSPPKKKKKKKKFAYALFSVSLGTAVIPGEI